MSSSQDIDLDEYIAVEGSNEERSPFEYDSS